MGSQLMEQPGVIEISTSTFGEREIVSNLTIIMAGPFDGGGYICMATNVVGQNTTAAQLYVHGESPLQLAFICIKKNCVIYVHYCLPQSYLTSPSLWRTVSRTL